MIFTAHPTSERVARARAAGARGFVSKSEDSDSLIAALRAVAAGGTWFGDETA